MSVPFFRPEIGDEEIAEVAACLRSGWLTSGPRTKQFEEDFAKVVGAQHVLAVNSCTAGLHLAVEALGLRERQAVLVPTWTFAATAEVVRYQGAIPVLVDCDPETFQICWEDAAHKLRLLRDGKLPGIAADTPVVGVIVVHMAGVMNDPEVSNAFAREHKLWLVEDAAHALPAAWRKDAESPWVRCGENTAAATCFSFYANKTITTGEGGMVATSDPELADRMKLMCLHGLSRDAWSRFSGGKSWDYRIVAPGFKYNLTDIQSAVGIHQLAKAESMRKARERIAHKYIDAFGDLEAFEIPKICSNRVDSWHLFPIRLNLDQLTLNRNDFIDTIRERGIGCSVHYRPLHLHPYYSEDAFAWSPELLPKASALWPRVLSLPLFSSQTDTEAETVIQVIQEVVREHQR